MTEKRFGAIANTEGFVKYIRDDAQKKIGLLTFDEFIDTANALHDENKELKDLLKSMADRNDEIWLDNGQIIRLKKVFNGEWTND